MCLTNKVLKSIILVACLMVNVSEEWKAVPAHESSYAYKPAYIGVENGPGRAGEDDEFLLPRDTLNSIYRFGWCTPDIFLPSFLKYKQIVKINNYEQSKSPFVYFFRENALAKNIECSVVKVYTPVSSELVNAHVSFQFCQASAFVLIAMKTRRYQLSEMYVPTGFSLPADIYLEIYYPY